MPHEFWREVVDRVAAEVPGTLLLAEAFWLMEGYFVRTLGMHRVYNSAFMNMLRDEENAKYRSVIKNTLEFDPDIMKRYVNFMSNPDERTAIDQFGTGEKCFGVAAMMATLPGLPMFGHGQMEGFTEKYGMEYQRPRYDETPDPWLVERHQREIAPLLKRRWLFAESAEFLLYDFFEPAGSVDENVFAYSNRNGGERALVIYNNRYGETQGTIDFSAAYADKGSAQLRQRRLREGLGLTDDGGVILAWRDSLTGLEYLRRASDLATRGLTVRLHAYQCHVFLDWRELRATAEWPLDRLCDQLNGHGVASIDEALALLELAPVHAALRALLEPDVVRSLADLAEHPRGTGTERKTARERSELVDVTWARCEEFVRSVLELPAAVIGRELEEPVEVADLATEFRICLRAAMRIPVVESLFPATWPAAARRVLPSASPERQSAGMWGPVLAWCALEQLAKAVDAERVPETALELFDRLRLRRPLGETFNAMGIDGEDGWRAAARIRVLLLSEAAERNAEAEAEPSCQVEASLWQDADVRWLCGVHEAREHEYLVREPYEELLWWLALPKLARIAGEAAPAKAEIEELVACVRGGVAEVEAAGYQVDQLATPASEPAEEGTTAADEDEPLEPECLDDSEIPVPEAEVTAVLFGDDEGGEE